MDSQKKLISQEETNEEPIEPATETQASSADNEETEADECATEIEDEQL